MINADFFEALELLEKEKGISAETMREKVRLALLTAFKKDYPEFTDAENIVVEYDADKKAMSMAIRKVVVTEEEVDDPIEQISLEEAKQYSKRAKLGGTVDVPIDTKNFGRIAAQSAKQMIIQSIREAERGLIFDEFTGKEHTILTGVVSKVEPRTGAVSIRLSSNNELTETMLSPSERIRGEELIEGDRIKVYVAEVRKSNKGPQVIISRTHPGLVEELFKLEVPEMQDGTVEIVSTAREAGSRTKIAVYSNDPEVDPIGAFVGPKGGRVASIVDELNGEKIDIIKYSDEPENYIASALSPSEVISVTMTEDGRGCRVIVPDDQLSLAIGKEGQNARLAARLTGFKIDIKPESES